MNTYTKSIDEHQIHTLLTQADSLISVIKDMEDIPVEDTENLLHIEYILHNFKESIDLTDKQLIKYKSVR